MALYTYILHEKLSMRSKVFKITSTSKTKLKATSDDRLNKWQTHFQKLLSNTPNVSDNVIEQIADSPLNINLGNFTPKKYQK